MSDFLDNNLTLSGFILLFILGHAFTFRAFQLLERRFNGMIKIWIACTAAELIFFVCLFSQ